nr:Crp/Fnr family transcriptional regulator [Kibdelosporangium sp. MJ126-NF4]CEL14457.1 transcriptional regulator, Crp/Fnr family [Kibdelosporangium sp. MJ126-NF4]CTQ88822.1 cAMP-binding proteins-catabolite gene activator and regulatory subunit of cAMP-dependent protein kinases [Kibdelosporangium sp. MJ126-NF4]
MGFWRQLTSAQRDQLAKIGTKVCYEEGDQILRQGAPDRHLVVVLAGVVKVVTSYSNGLQRVLTLRGPGALLGEIAALTALPRTAGVAATSKVTALLINNVEFAAATRADQALHDQVEQALAERLLATNQQLVEAFVPAVLPRLAGLLASLGDQLETAVLPISQPDLASLAATSEASVARSLRALRARGLIRTGRRRIEVIDSPGLRAYAETYDVEP